MAKTEAQKAKRKLKKAAAKIKSREHGEKILKAAMKSGYTPVNKKFVGKGDYSMLKAKLRGRGDYLEDVANGGAALVGKGIRYVGEKALGWLSGAAKGLLGSLLGSGDYTASGHPRANSMSSTTTAMPGVVSTQGRGNIIRNTEMIASIFAHDTIQTTEWHLSPGLSNTFPWLHPTGDMYQEWRMNGGVVTYVPTVAPLDDAAGGDLVFNIEYDLDAPLPTTIQEVTGSYLAVAGRPLDRMVMAIECAPHETPYNVYLTRTTEVLDAPHYPYDLGKLRATVANQPTASNGKLLGRLYITYEMEFFKPMVRSIPLTIPMMYADSDANTIAESSIFSGTEAAWNSFLKPSSTIKPTWINGSTLQMPSFVRSGKWLFIAQCGGAGAGTAFVKSGYTLTDCAECKIFRDDTGAYTGFIDSTTGTVLQVPCQVLLALEVTGPSPTISLTGGTWDNGSTTWLFLPISADILGLNRALRMNKDYYDRKTEEAAALQRTIGRIIERQETKLRNEFEEVKRRVNPERDPRYDDFHDMGWGEAEQRLARVRQRDVDEEKVPNSRRQDPSPARIPNSLKAPL